MGHGLSSRPCLIFFGIFLTYESTNAGSWSGPDEHILFTIFLLTLTTVLLNVSPWLKVINA